MKQEIRNQYLLYRRGLSNQRRLEANSKIYELLREMSAGYQNILSYSSLEDEVCLTSFNKILAEEKRLSLPRIEQGTLVPYRVADMEKELKTFSHRFLEPDFSCIKNEMIDLVIVPGVVFDKNGGRLGLGKGFYDKFLEKHPAQTIGVCFKEQLFEGVLPLEKHDIYVEKLCVV